MILVGGQVALGQPTIAADRPGFGGGCHAGCPRDLSGRTRGGIGSVAFDAPNTEYTGTSLGGKLRLLQAPTNTLSVVSTWALPTGSGLFDADNVAQTAMLAFNGALERSSDSPSTSVLRSRTPQTRGSYQFIPTLNVDLTETVDTYVGYAGFYPDGPNTNFAEAGITVLPGPDIQLDLNTGFQVDEGRDAFFVGVRLARRF